MKRSIDTSAYVALKQGDERVATLVRASDEILISIVVVAELMFGFRNGSRYDRNVEELQALLRRPAVSVQDAGWTTADRFGRIAAALRRAGTPIPSNDIWIAAHAMEHGAELVTLDRHFQSIPGLALALVDS